MKRDYFLIYHPLINFAYFSVVIIFAIAVFEPVCGIISMIGAVAYSVLLNGKKALRFFCSVSLVIMIMMAAANLLFVHKGVSVLFMIGDTQFTMQALVYGCCAALMTGSVIMWFYCYSVVMTSDRFMAVFGRVAPSLSLVFSMALRFIPRFSEQAGRIDEAQRMLLAGKTDQDQEGSQKEDSQKERRLFGKIRRGARISSVMATWALENSIETSDSMRSRGYGLPGRTNYSGHFFRKRDAVMGAFLFALCIIVTAAKARGILYFAAYPVIYMSKTGMTKIIVWAVYGILCLLPAGMQAGEEALCRHLRSEI